MAQATNYVYDYVLTLRVKAGKTYTSADILAMMPSGTNPTTVHLMSAECVISVSTGTAQSDGVTFKRGDLARLAAGRSWTFFSDAELALAELVNLAV